MTKTGLNYYDLLKASNLTPSSLQAWVDGYFDQYNVRMWDGFDFDPEPMIDYTYEQFQSELKINVMATYVNPDSPAKAQSTQGFSLLSGTIPTIKTNLERDAKEVRDLMKIDKMMGGNAIVTSAISQLYKKFDHMLSSHVNSITFQRNQMVSRGKLELLDTMNPNGIVGVTYSAQIPDANFITKTANAKWWTTAAHTAEGTEANPIVDLKARVRALNNVGITKITMEIDALTLADLVNHSKVVQAIGYGLNPLADSAAIAQAVGNNLTDSQRIEKLASIIGVTIKPIDNIASVEKFNKTTKKIEFTQIRGFAADTCVFYPTGKLGSIKHVLPLMPATDNGGAVALYFNGSLVSRVYSDINTNVQYYNTEQAVLCVIDIPKYVYNLKVA